MQPTPHSAISLRDTEVNTIWILSFLVGVQPMQPFFLCLTDGGDPKWS
jgi:hypothetical protein